MTETVRIEIPIETIDETEPDLSNVTKKLDKMSNAVTKAGSSSERARERVSKFDKAAERTQKSLSKWAKEKYEVLLEAKERITPVLQTLGNGIRNFTGRTWRVTMKAVDLVTAPVRGILNVLKNPIFQVGAVLGVSIGLKDTIDTYKDFEAAMSQVSAVSGATGSDLDKLTAKAKEMGSTTKFTATEAAEGFNYMSMAGWKTQDMLDGIEGIMNLAAASGEELATTSDIVTDALTAFNLQASDSGHFADVLAQASSNANTNVGMMGESFKYIAPVAGAMKYSVEDVSLALGLMANASVKSSMAGTSLKTALVNMAKPTEKMEAAMKKYGISLTEKSGKAKDLKGVLDNLRGSLGKLSETEQTAAAGTIFGKEAMAGMLAIVNASEKDYNKLTKAVNNADGASERMAETMLDNLEGSITIFQSALDGVKLSLGKRMSPYVRSAADWLTEMMPSVEAALDDLMDYIDRKADKFKAKFSDITSTADWQDAGIFGKTKIMWDEFIADPLIDWWETTGKAKVANAMGDFGEVLGSGLHAGILTLLGFDVSETLNEGSVIGKQFAKGFADGFDFDEISSKLWDGFKSIFGNAGKLLPGGQSADLSSLMSAALLAKVAGPLFGIGSGSVKLGKTLMGSSTSTGGGLLAGSLLGSAATGSGILGFGANTAINLGAGNLAGGASLGTGALSAVGLGATAGGVAGGASLISGGLDFYKATKTETKEESDAYTKSGAWKVGGVAAGAAAGAAIGSVVPVLGTAVGALIGAGAGGIAGWIKGNKVKQEYEENLKEAQEVAANAQKVYAATGRNIEEVKFKTQALKDSMNDAEVTVEEFTQMFQEAVQNNLEEHFGNIHLSLEEIKNLAADMTFGKQAEKLTEYAEAAENAGNSLDMYAASVSELKKQNWRASLDTKMDVGEVEDYKTAIDNFAQNAQDYMKNQHYESTLAIQLIAGKKDGKEMIDSLDGTYSSMESELNELSSKLSKRVEKALEDGVIGAKEQKSITSLQNKIQKITEQVSSAQQEASMDALKIKYSGASLDSSSFTSLQTEIQANIDSASSEYDEALILTLSNLKLELDSGAIDSDEYTKQYAKLKEKYNQQMQELYEKAEDFQLDTIAESYSEELKRLPDYINSEDISAHLKEKMNEALSVQPDPQQWSGTEIAQWFGLSDLDDETLKNVTELLRSTAESIPDNVADAMNQTGTSVGNQVTSAVRSSISGSEGEIRSAIEQAVQGAAATPFDIATTVNVKVKTNTTTEGSSYDRTSSSTNSTASPGPQPMSSPVPTNHASGGYVGSRQLSWLAEEGYGEFVIPTNPSRRSRALELYDQAGQMLGVSKHADGGFVTPSGDVDLSNIDGEQSSFSPEYSDNSVGSTTVQVNVEVNPEFTINGTDGKSTEDISEVIRRHIREMADELGGEIASQLETIFSNRPLKEA